MTTLFPDYNDLEHDLLRLPWRDRTYSIPEVGIQGALLVRRAVAGDAAAMSEWDEGDRSYRIFLGIAYDEMVADNAPESFIERAHNTALTDFQFGREAALRVWKAGADPVTRAALLAASREILADADDSAASE